MKDMREGLRKWKGEGNRERKVEGKDMGGWRGKGKKLGETVEGKDFGR
jgi:hypothetical protein